mmetsp:Transcript_8911/g.14047  ORF Transcript_8911/g.14047 Transcript_8911/m.14047 type:complete len:82 (-) Transcript_8911:4638-4883(-)
MVQRLNTPLDIGLHAESGTFGINPEPRDSADESDVRRFPGLFDVRRHFGLRLEPRRLRLSKVVERFRRLRVCFRSMRPVDC